MQKIVKIFTIQMIHFIARRFGVARKERLLPLREDKQSQRGDNRQLGDT